MTDMRQFRRIKYIAVGTLQYRDTAFDCQIENLSLTGALVTIKSKPCFRSGYLCVLKLNDELVGRNLVIETLVAHQTAEYAGLKFIEHDVKTQILLEEIMERDSNVDWGKIDHAKPTTVTLQPYARGR